jgi:hypothetical protein
MENQKKQECDSMNNDCGGFRHCSSDKFNPEDKKCKECIKDAEIGIYQSLLNIRTY